MEFADKTGRYPELQLWHTPVPIGVADMIGYDDRGFVVASGTYLPGYEDVGERLEQMAKEQPLGCSHGFQYDRLDRMDGVFDWYETREITVLPLQKAANRLTASTPLGSKETEMLTDDKAAFLREALGDDRYQRIEGSLDELARKAAADGLDFKDVSAAAEAPPAAPAAETPAVVIPTAAVEGATVAPEGVTAVSGADTAVVIQHGTQTDVPGVATAVVEGLAAQGALEPAPEPPRNAEGEVIVESGTVAVTARSCRTRCRRRASRRPPPSL